jgi:5-methylthioribose kinase
MSTQHTRLATILRQQGYLRPGEPIQVEPLGGGVSNEVLRVTTPHTRLVIKQSLPKLRVQMEWYADQARIWRERDYLLCVGGWFPANVPAVLFSDEANYVLAIEEITGATLWKSSLLAGHCDLAVAARAGELLAQIHSRSHAEPALAKGFQRKASRHEDSFDQLRIDPYWRTVARRHPDLAPAIEGIIAAMEAQPLALVHGDYSPKNIFVKPDGDLVILDAEVAHWGDPTFDVGFCLNHFLLKAVYHGPQGAAFVAGAEHFWAAYQQAARPPVLGASVAERLPGQLAALLLARVDGKSPVEYLVDQPGKQAAVRAVARTALLDHELTLPALFTAIRQGLTA